LITAPIVVMLMSLPTPSVGDMTVVLPRASRCAIRISLTWLSLESTRHGFLFLSDVAEFLYKRTDYYSPEYERSLYWNDPTIGVEWPLAQAPILAAKD